MTFWVLFAIVVYYNLDIDQIDIKTAILYGMIDQLVYMEILMRSENFANKKIICKLLKAVYGLKTLKNSNMSESFSFYSKS